MLTDPDAVLTPVRRGRPPVEVPRTSLTVWLSPATADHIIALAQRHDVPVSAFLRMVVEEVTTSPGGVAFFRQE